MSLSDRLAQRVTPTVVSTEKRGGAHRLPIEPPRRAGRQVDPYAAVKRNVHEGLLEVLGPKLYDVQLDQKELELQVTQTLQAVLQRDETPLTIADRSRVAQEVADEILGHGTIEQYMRAPSCSAIMWNGHDQS